MEKTEKALYRRKFLMIVIAFFGVVIAVNVTMAVKAVKTFLPEVSNSYVASQTFDKDRAAQEALGWGGGAQLRARLPVAADPRPWRPAGAGLRYIGPGRAHHYGQRGYAAGISLFGRDLLRAGGAGYGAWLIHLEAKAQDGTSAPPAAGSFRGEVNERLVGLE